MPTPTHPVEYDLMKQVVGVPVSFDEPVRSGTPGNLVLRIEGRIGDDEANDTEHCALGFIYALGVLSFADARPRGYSEKEFVEGDQWYAADMHQHLSFRRGELRFYADYVRGRMMKTDLVLRSDGTFSLMTVNRGEAATRWLGRLQGKKPLSVVADGSAG